MFRSFRSGWYFALFALPCLHADVLYTTVPQVLPPNLPSLGYQATRTAEFGGLVQLSPGGPAVLDVAVVVMSNWALESTYEPVGTSSGFDFPFALNLYNPGPDDSVGSLIGTFTGTGFVPWRPEANTNPAPAGCGANSTRYLASDGNCYNGSLSTVTVQLGGIAVPPEFIYGFAYDTQSAGANPLGVAGPFDSLNFAVSSQAPRVGSNPLMGIVYWNTSGAGNYADGGAGGVGVLRQDTGWGTYSGAVTFDGTPTPEPAVRLLLAACCLGLGFKLRAAHRSRK